MINREAALAMAESYLENSPYDVVICYEKEFSGGWVFCYQTREFIEEGAFSAQLAGNGPLLVDRFTAELVVLGTHQPIECFVEKYLQQKMQLATEL